MVGSRARSSWGPSHLFCKGLMASGLGPAAPQAASLWLSSAAVARPQNRQVENRRQGCDPGKLVLRPALSHEAGCTSASFFFFFFQLRGWRGRGGPGDQWGLGLDWKACVLPALPVCFLEGLSFHNGPVFCQIGLQGTKVKKTKLSFP